MPLVLIIEDDTIIRDALSDALTNAGHTVRAVGSALAGLRELHREKPDVDILDLGLPDLDGADALRMLRSVSDVPVIVATARRGESDAIRLLNAGADDYLAARPEVLAAAIPGARWRVLAGDHLNVVRNPEFIEAIVKFLD